MGRAMKNLDRLLAMPYGCGEQNMVLFAPNVFILNYLKSTDQLTPDVQEKARRFLESGKTPPHFPLALARSDANWSVICRLSEGTHLQARRRILQRFWEERRVRKHLVGTSPSPPPPPSEHTEKVRLYKWDVGCVSVSNLSLTFLASVPPSPRRGEKNIAWRLRNNSLPAR